MKVKVKVGRMIVTFGLKKQATFRIISRFYGKEGQNHDEQQATDGGSVRRQPVP